VIRRRVAWDGLAIRPFRTLREQRSFSRLKQDGLAIRPPSPFHQTDGIFIPETDVRVSSSGDSGRGGDSGSGGAVTTRTSPGEGTGAGRDSQAGSRVTATSTGRTSMRMGSETPFDNRPCGGETRRRGGTNK